MNSLEQQIAELTTEIEHRATAYEEVLRRIDTIPGFDRITAWMALAEIGTDMTVFEDARHLAS